MKKPTLDQAWTIAAANPGTVVEFDERIVVCDFCADDHTDKADVGGILIRSTAICPKCASTYADSIEIDRRESPAAIRDPNPGETFADFIRRTRAEKPGKPSVSIGPLFPEPTRHDDIH